MPAVTDLLDRLPPVLAWADAHGEVLTLAGLAASVLVLAWIVRRAVRSGRPDKWLSVVSLVVGMSWSAEAMWEIATQRLNLSIAFAALVFFVFESQLGVSMLRADRHQRVHNHPGRYGRTAWLIAVVMGVVAALAGDSAVEAALRLVVPLLVTKQWWDGLTADGTTRAAEAITWAWTPRRILVALGLARPGRQDLMTVDRQRHILAVARVSHRLHSTGSRWLRAWHQGRLRRLAMTSDDDILAAARAHVERVWRSADMTRPLAPEDLEAVAAAKAAQAEAEARAEAETARRLKAEEEASRRAETVQRLSDEARAEIGILRAENAELAALRAENAQLRTAKEVLASQYHEAQVQVHRDLGRAEREIADLRQQIQQAETRRRRPAETATGNGRRLAAAAVPLPLPPGATLPEVDGVRPETAGAILLARATNPDATQARLTELTGISERTIRKVLNATTVSGPAGEGGDGQ